MVHAREVTYEKINPEVKPLWVQALRSGEYPQGRGRLNRKATFTNEPIGYCCLGVLCDVYKSTTGKGEWGPDGRGHFGSAFIASPGDQSATTLPTAVTEWSGLEEYRAVAQLVEMNDSHGNHRDFDGIADWIEENL